MTPDAIAAGMGVLIDANVIVYAVQGISAQCVRLLDRCAQEEVLGVVAVHTLAEVMHVLMIAEARDSGLLDKGARPAAWLASHPERVRLMSRYDTIVRDVMAGGMQIEPLTPADIPAALTVQRQTGLLTNDALLLATGQRLRVLAIASADRALAAAEGFTVYAPDDVGVQC